ncbi:MAG: thiamine pyrophosphate-dependent enzyme [Blautia sp.]
MNLWKPDRIGIVPETGFCPGCGHGVVTRLVAEAADELGMNERLVMTHDVACGYIGAASMRFDAIVAAHGRPVPTASGYKRVRPDNIACAYLGDGSAYSIGIAELIHAALRNENITVVVVNNTVYGMTGGQMAPTSLPGEKTMSSVYGKDPEKYGTLNVMDLLGTQKIAYLARGEIYDVASTAKAKKMIKKAFQCQMEKKGFSLVEVLSPCPTNFHMTPLKAKEYIHTEAVKYFPLGEFIHGAEEGEK